MNGIIIPAVVVLSIGIIGLAFGLVHELNAIERITSEIIDLNARITKCKSDTASMITDMKAMKMTITETRQKCGEDIAQMRRQIIGTADADEFSRVKTAAFSADFRSKGLEKVIHSMSGNEIMPRRRKSIQKGLMTVSIADDEHAINPEVRDSDA